MTGLVEFLLARIAEDERIARAATRGNANHPRWTAEPNMRLEEGCRCLSCWEPIPGSWDVYPIDGPDCPIHDCHHTMTIGEDDAGHIARWDPTRVLAECTMRRTVVGWFQVLDAHPNRVTLEPRRNELRHVLVALARPYSGHPDWREVWDQ